MVEQSRRDDDSLRPDFSRRRIEGAGYRSAHVGPVRAGNCERVDRAVEKDGPDQPNILVVRAGPVRVVDDEHIARRDCVAEVLEHGLDRELERPHVRRDIDHAVRDQASIPGQDTDGVVSALSDDRPPGHPLDERRTLRAHRAEAVAQNCEGDRIHWFRGHAPSSALAVHRHGFTSLVSYSFRISWVFISKRGSA